MTTPQKHYSPAFKSQVVQELSKVISVSSRLPSEHAVHPNVIAKWKRAALEALPDTFDERSDKQFKALIDRYEKEKEELYAQIGRLTTELRWLEKKSEAGFAQIKQGGPDSERNHDRDRLEAEGERPLPLSRQAELLSISRSSLYYRPVEPSQREITLKRCIDEIFTQYPFYGYRRNSPAAPSRRFCPKS